MGSAKDHALRGGIQPSPAEALEALPPGTYTNRYELKGAAPSSVTVILLDFLNTKIADRNYARGQVTRFLGTQLCPDDRVALYALDSRLRLLYDFTDDAAQLVQALGQFKSRTIKLENYAPIPAGGANPEMDKVVGRILLQFEQNVTDFYTATRIESTAAALQAIANRVTSLPGRKNLVWITGSVPFSLGLVALTGGKVRQTSSVLQR